MGKRELLLILAFAAAGVIVYHVSAPPRTTPRRTLGELARRLVRELRPESARAEYRQAQSTPVPASVQALRVQNATRVTVQGEPRADVAVDLTVTSTGTDEAEARRLAAATTLRLDTATDALLLAVDYPAEGRQQADLTVRVPSRLRVRLEDVRTALVVSDVAGVALGSTRGTARLTKIAGPVEGDHRGGTLELADVGTVRLRTRGSAVRLDRVRGTVGLDVTAGSLRANALKGPVQLETRGADAELDGVAGPVEATIAAGRLTLKGVVDSVRCDAQGATVRLHLARPVEVAVFSTGGTLEVALPPSAAVDLDAVATDGAIRLEGIDLPVAVDGRRQRVAGPLGRGGPRISLRATGGGITVRRVEG